MKYTWILILLFAAACSSSSTESDENLTETEITEEMDDVDAMLQKDQQRIDSMEKALLEQMENSEEE